MNKQLLDQLITKHYQYLLGVAINITRRSNKTDLEYNLLHEVVITLYKRLDEHNEFLKTDLDFKKYVTKCLKQFFDWQKNMRHYNKKDNALFSWEPYECNMVNQAEREGNNYHDGDVRYLTPKNEIDNKAEELIYLNAENTNHITKLFLEDMLLNDIPIEKGLMVNKIKDVAKTLDLLEYQIFDMYYLQELSCLEIHAEMNKHKKRSMGYHYILNLQKQVKQKIIDKLQ